MGLKDKNYYQKLSLDTLSELETDDGILASSREEVYGCIFGRDTLITCLKLLRVYKKSGDRSLLTLVRKSLLTLADLQGKQVNIESGEEPGKCIHEYRPTEHERLTKLKEPTWYLYEDSIMRNYDSVDSTPLMLIAFYRYWQYSKDDQFMLQTEPNVKAALKWCHSYGDVNNDEFIDYQFSKERKHGGLISQNWMDSVESVFRDTGDPLAYPLAPVEVQAYAYMAYRLWAKYFAPADPQYSEFLTHKADKLKEKFNSVYVSHDPEGNVFLVYKLDAAGRPFRAVRSNMGHVLWASLNKEDDGEIDCILKPEYIPGIVRRLMMPDIFEPKAGIRTLSSLSRDYQPNSYHNGSIWPHDNAIIAEGFEIHGYRKEAETVKTAVLGAIGQFKTPIELFVSSDGHLTDWVGSDGQRSCRKQAWSAAGILDMAT